MIQSKAQIKSKLKEFPPIRGCEMDFKLHEHLALGHLNSILELLRMDWPMKLLLVVWLALAHETTAWQGPGTGWHPTSSRGMPRNLRSLWPRHCHANFSSYSLPLSLGISAFIKGHRQGLSLGWSLMLLHVSAYFWHQFPPLSVHPFRWECQKGSNKSYPGWHPCPLLPPGLSFPLEYHSLTSYPSSGYHSP